MTENEKKALKARCDAIVNSNSGRRTQYLSGKLIQKLMVKIGRPDFLPVLSTPRYRIGRGRHILKIFNMYLKFLIEESLKYPIEIYIPYIGILRIFETDSVGKKSLWEENGKLVYRMDTVFDQKVKYWMTGLMFGYEDSDFATKFFLLKRYIKPILRKVYLAHPDGGFYNKYKADK